MIDESGTTLLLASNVDPLVVNHTVWSVLYGDDRGVYE